MDGLHFDNLLRALTASRRSLVGGVLAIVPRWLGVHAANAKKKPKQKKREKKAKPNAFGCLSVGKSCQNAGECCSGICAGKRRNKRCRAHDRGGCPAGFFLTGCEGTVRLCTTMSGIAGECGTTTGNAGYCEVANSDCFPCTKDADCRAVCGPRAACLQCAGGCDVGTVCAGPDGAECSG